MISLASSSSSILTLASAFDLDGLLLETIDDRIKAVRMSFDSDVAAADDAVDPDELLSLV